MDYEDHFSLCDVAVNDYESINVDDSKSSSHLEPCTFYTDLFPNFEDNYNETEDDILQRIYGEDNDTMFNASNRQQSSFQSLSSFHVDGVNQNHTSLNPTSSNVISPSTHWKQSNPPVSRMKRQDSKYRERRKKNNEAVRKSRQKTKQRQSFIIKQVEEMRHENERLKQDMRSKYRELQTLRTIMKKVNVKIPDNINRILNSCKNYVGQ